MKKKLKIGIIFIIVAVLVGGFIVGIGHKKETKAKQGVNHQEEKKEDTNKTRKNLQASCYDAPIYEQDEEVVQDDWSYQIHSVEWTKKQGNWSKPDEGKYAGEWYKYDEEGNVLGDITLVKINITIKRIKETDFWKDETLWLNSNWLQFYESSGKDMYENYEVIASRESDMDRRDAFCTSVKEKGDEITTDIIFAVEDTLLEKAGYCLFHINNQGVYESELSPDEHCYIRISKGEDTDENTSEK